MNGVHGSRFMICKRIVLDLEGRDGGLGSSSSDYNVALSELTKVSGADPLSSVSS